jgi:hypothetical protein
MGTKAGIRHQAHMGANMRMMLCKPPNAYVGASHAQLAGVSKNRPVQIMPSRATVPDAALSFAKRDQTNRGGFPNHYADSGLRLYFTGTS